MTHTIEELDVYMGRLLTAIEVMTKLIKIYDLKLNEFENRLSKLEELSR